MLFVAESMVSVFCSKAMDGCSRARDPGRQVYIRINHCLRAKILKKPSAVRTSRYWRGSSEGLSDRRTISRRTGNSSNLRSTPSDVQYQWTAKLTADDSCIAVIRRVEDC